MLRQYSAVSGPPAVARPFLLPRQSMALRAILTMPGNQRCRGASFMSDLSHLAYQSGFGNEFATEAHPGALPIGQNSPQKHPLGLYTEQVSGSAFTAPRGLNRRTWICLLYTSDAADDLLCVD